MKSHSDYMGIPARVFVKLNGKVPRIDINDFVWLKGKDKNKNAKPYHLTRTTSYWLVLFRQIFTFHLYKIIIIERNNFYEWDVLFWGEFG